MHLHANQLDTWKGVVYERKMLIVEFPTVHFASFEGSDTVPIQMGLVPNP